MFERENCKFLCDYRDKIYRLTLLPTGVRLIVKSTILDKSVGKVASLLR